MSRPLAAPDIHYSYTTMQRLHSKYHEAYAGQWFSSNLPDSDSESPGWNPTAGSCVITTTAVTYSLGNGLHALLQCVGRLSLPSSVVR